MNQTTDPETAKRIAKDVANIMRVRGVLETEISKATNANLATTAVKARMLGGNAVMLEGRRTESLHSSGVSARDVASVAKGVQKTLRRVEVRALGCVRAHPSRRVRVFQETNQATSILKEQLEDALGEATEEADADALSTPMDTTADELMSEWAARRADALPMPPAADDAADAEDVVDPGPLHAPVHHSAKHAPDDE